MSRSVCIALVVLAGCTAPGVENLTNYPFPPQEGSTTSSSTSTGDEASSESSTVMTSTSTSTTSGSEAGSDGSTESTDSTGEGSSSTTTGAASECGDGILDADEECDDANADPDDGCAACFRDRWVFATSMVFQPDLIGGLAGADHLCGQLANQAGLGANWKGYRAWLSDSTSSAGERVFPGMGRYRRVDGEVIAENFERDAQPGVEGIDARLHAPFLDLLRQAREQETPVSTGDLRWLAGLCVQLVEHIRERVRMVGFWKNASYQEELRSQIFMFLDEHSIVDIDAAERLADRLMELAKANHDRLTAT